MKALALLALATATAHAECPVDITAAPDDVRLRIEDWAHREQVCGGKLEVRVVATEGGLLLFARDARGRTRQRTVPDAESAAVLVASWMADDSLASPSATTIDVNVHVGIDPVTGEVRDDRDQEPAPRVEPHRVAAASQGVTSGSAITIGAMAGVGVQDSLGTGGVRAELELTRVGRWTFAAVAAVGSAHMDIYDTAHPDRGGPGATTDYRLLFSVGPTFWFGQWSFRPALAGGLVVRDATIHAMGTETFTSHGYELSFAFARNLSGPWAIVIEPMITLMKADIVTIDGSNNIGLGDHLARPSELNVALGLRRAL